MTPPFAVQERAKVMDEPASWAIVDKNGVDVFDVAWLKKDWTENVVAQMNDRPDRWKDYAAALAVLMLEPEVLPMQ